MGCVVGPEHPDTLNHEADFASMNQREGNYGVAETLTKQVLKGRRRLRL